MIDKDRIVPFVKLGEHIYDILKNSDRDFYRSIQNQNNWFTEESVRLALDGVAGCLSEKALTQWLAPYQLDGLSDKRVGVIMAGNIPMVGFHDLLSVLISGHRIMAKPSSQDSLLIGMVIKALVDIEPAFRERIEIVERLNEADAFIGTGSDNSARYFQYYFGKKPHIIRQNRTSVAVLTGDETIEQFQNLGKDIFTYYGLGCRNVSKVFVPKGYSFQSFLDALQGFDHVGDHHKYRNNYDYNKSIYLVNRVPHLDTGYLLLKESPDLVSPISVLFYEEYQDEKQLGLLLEQYKDKIQCVVGEGHVPFGTAQQPELWDYADGVDTLKFLSQLR